MVAALIIEYVGRKHEELMANVPEGNTLENLLEYFILWAGAGEKDLRFSRFNRFIMCQMEWSDAVIDRIDRTLALTKNFHLEKVNQVLVDLKAKDELREGLDINMIQHIIVATYMGIVFSSLSKRTDYNVTNMVRVGLSLLFESIRKK